MEPEEIFISNKRINNIREKISDADKILTTTNKLIEKYPENYSLKVDSNTFEYIKNNLSKELHEFEELIDDIIDLEVPSHEKRNMVHLVSEKMKEMEKYIQTSDVDEVTIQIKNLLNNRPDAEINEWNVRELFLFKGSAEYILYGLGATV